MCPDFDPNEALSRYILELRCVRAIESEELRELLNHRDFEPAARRLIKGHLALALQAAQRKAFPHPPSLDLIEKGNRGLLDAVSTFTGDPQQFEDFAVARIERALESDSPDP
jgi:DNA-directed RNA polymerase sigma subunit (sigma70/sigma32)